jgi:hypothetical protein
MKRRTPVGSGGLAAGFSLEPVAFDRRSAATSMSPRA